MYDEGVSYGRRDYGAFLKSSRGFREVGNRNCESFVGFDIDNHARGSESVSLLDSGFRYTRPGAVETTCAAIWDIGGYRDAFRKSNRVGLVECVASGSVGLLLYYVGHFWVSSSVYGTCLRESFVVVLREYR